MRIRIFVCATLCFAVITGSALTFKSFAQAKGKTEKTAKSEKTTNVQGKVGTVEKDTITVLMGTNPKPVMFNSDTKFMMGHSNDNKPGSIGDIKPGNFIACSGSMDAKMQFVAKQCVYRDKQ